MNFDELKSEEDDLRKEITALPPEQRKRYYQIEKQRLKDPDTYAVLNYFFLAGLHHFYLGKNLYGMINITVMLIGIIFIMSYGWVLFIAVLLFELPQLFRSQNIVQKYNNDVMRDTLNKVRIS